MLQRRACTGLTTCIRGFTYVLAMPGKRSVGPSTPSSSANAFSALSLSEEAIEEATRPMSATTKPASPKSVPKSLLNPIVWIDLEMTGLDLDKDTVIEIAVIITDGELSRCIEGPATAIHHPDEILDTMNPWCIEHHGKSGLTKRVKESTVDMAEAQQMVLEFVKLHIPEQGTAVLAGNSVHVDRSFLVKHMPEFVEHLHYRIIDVSTIKELAKRWYPKEWRCAPRKRLEHTALSDIRESIEELKHWKYVLFKNQGHGAK